MENININLNKLYYFYVVASLGSIKASSKKLHLTEPTISTQIKQLEESLGFPLFVRQHRKLELNRNGSYFYKKASEIFRLAEELEDSLPKFNDTQTRLKIKIGAIQSLSNTFISNFSIKLWQDPNIELSIVQEDLKTLTKKITNGKIDMILSDSPFQKGKKFQSVQLSKDDLVAVCAIDNKTYKSSEFPSCLHERAFIAYSNQGRLQDDLSYFFEINDIIPDTIGMVDDVNLMTVITAKSKSFSILPKRVAAKAIKNKELSPIGTLPGIKHSLWAIIPTLNSNRGIIKKLLKEYFISKG